MGLLEDLAEAQTRQAARLDALEAQVTELAALVAGQTAPGPGPDPDGGTGSAPVPTPGPPPEAPLDLSAVTWLHTDVADWAVTSTITRIRFGSDTLEVNHTKQGRWPEVDIGDGERKIVEANPWVFVEVDGRWYAATYEWLRPDVYRKGIHRGNIGAHIKKPPLDRWTPADGEEVYFMISTLARDSRFRSPTKERTDIVRAAWGRDWKRS